MHSLAHRLVAAEREGQVGDPAGHVHVRQVLADFPRRLDEIDAVIIVLVDPGRDGKNVRIEDDVFRREAHLFGQDAVGARANLDLALAGIRLALLVESHDDDRGTVAHHGSRVLDKGLLTLFKGNRIHDRLALHAFQTRLDHLEFRGIDHDRHARDIGFGGDEMQELGHRLH
jgi:hypothetical protein